MTEIVTQYMTDLTWAFWAGAGAATLIFVVLISIGAVLSGCIDSEENDKQ